MCRWQSLTGNSTKEELAKKANELPEVRPIALSITACYANCTSPTDGDLLEIGLQGTKKTPATEWVETTLGSAPFLCRCPGTGYLRSC